MVLGGRSRRYHDLQIFVNQHQDGLNRFDRSEDGINPAPRLAQYRNNLIAFSQYHNLLFVASQDSILVYEPHGADQILTEPLLSTVVAGSKRGLAGYIDRFNGHALNHLVVADLGIEEILVAACDDGDVIAYTTQSFRNEIKRRQQGFYPNVLDYCPQGKIRPFFVQNVKKSAWGLAVHKKARMIAVSSNTGKIHVFVFALTGRPFDPSILSLHPFTNLVEYEIPSPEWINARTFSKLSVPDRSRNVEIVLEGHDTNIPAVTFYNTDGQCGNDVLLVSTDIDNVTRIWDVWERRQVAKLDASLQDLRGWGVACIAPNTCKKPPPLMDLSGFQGMVFQQQTDVTTDITEAADGVPDSCRDHFLLRNSPGQVPAPGSPYDYSGYINSDSEESESSELDDESQDELDTQEPLQFSNELEQTDSTHPLPSASWSDEEDDAIDWQQVQAAQATVNPRDIIKRADPDSSPPTPAGVQEPLRSPTLRCGESPKPVLPFYLLQTSQSNISLYHSFSPPVKKCESESDDGYITDDEIPLIRKARHVVCRSPLVQRLPANYPHNTGLSRLNMVLQIPELSLVVVGDQFGRAALLTITRRRSPRNIAASAGTRGLKREIHTIDQSGKIQNPSPLKQWDSKEDDSVGYRFERFLPLSWEEDAKRRPLKDLLGIAAAPIQDHEFKRADGLGDERSFQQRKSERWRFEGSR
ncbi:MAG: hypothetical protein Q9174_002810, partial [Haloplaca sp. 1 TL-2023]